jgi:hypothetical protein
VASDDPSGYRSLVLNVHYDNPTNVGGLMDDSGVKFYVTPKQRKYEAGTLQVLNYP